MDYLVVMLFHQQFELSFWQHLFTAEDPFVSKALSTLTCFPFEDASFSLHFGLPSTLRQCFCQGKTKLFENDLQSGYFETPFLHCSLDCENDDACLVMWHYVYTGICLLCAIRFHTIATDVLLYTLFISQSYKDDRKFTRKCCLRQNIRAVAF